MVIPSLLELSCAKAASLAELTAPNESSVEADEQKVRDENRWSISDPVVANNGEHWCKHYITDKHSH
jgi:hypothetical protein